jgi:diguanylate cyclase (GGDEF)-like protein/PAS domain S-box-containing protein
MMNNWLLKWLPPPVFNNDEEKKQQTILLNAITIFILVLLFLFILGSLLGGQTPLIVLILDFLIIANTLLVRYWLYHDRLKLAAVWLVSTTFVLLTGIIFYRGTIHYPTTATYILVVIIASLLFNRRGIILTTLASSLAIMGLELAENANLLPPSYEIINVTQWIIYTVLIGLTGGLTYFSNQLIQQALSHSRTENAERQRMENELRKVMKAVEWQRDLAQELAAATSIHPALNLCLERVLAATSLDSGGIYLENHTTNDFELIVSQGLPEPFIQSVAHLAVDSPRWNLIMAGQPVYTVYEQVQNQNSPAEINEGLKAFGLIPILYQGKVAGSFNLASHSFDTIEAVNRTMIEETVMNLGNTLVRLQAREELQHNHDRLRLSEEQFRTVFEYSRMGMAMVNLEGRFFRVNQAFCQMLGYEEKELLGMSVAEVTLEEDLPQTRDIGEKLRSGEEEIAQVEKQYRHRSGSVVWASITVSLIRDAENRPLHNVVMAQNITARKQTETLQQAIYHISETVATAANLDALYPALHRIIAGLLPARNLYFALYDSANDRVTFPYYVDEQFEEYRDRQGGRGLTEYVIRSGQTQVVNLERFYQLKQAGEVKHSPDVLSLNILGVPLKGAGGQILGALVVRTYIEGEAYTEQDKEILNFVSIQVGLAIERKRAEEIQHIALEKYRVLFESFPLGIAISDSAGHILETNQAAERLLEIPRTEQEHRNIDSKAWQIIRPDGSPLPPEEYASVLALHEKLRVDNVEMGIVKEEGRITWLEVTAAPIPLEGYGVAVAYSDISARRQIEARLERDRQIFQQIIDKAHTHLVYLDPLFNFVEVNAGYARTCRLDPQELIGKNHFYFYPDPENEEIFRRVRDTRQPVAFHDKPFVFPDQPERGVTYWDWTISPDIDKTGNLLGLVFSLTETTSRKKIEEELQRTNQQLNKQLNLVTELKDQLSEQVVRDVLTGLHNRRYLYEALPGEIIRARREENPVSIMMMDIDHFKRVNDTYGHVAGDEVLKEIAHLLTIFARGSDIACRYGGEEFLLVLLGANLEAALKRAEQLRQKCAEAIIYHEGHQIQVTLSFGVAVYPKHGSSVDEVLNNADRALYISKQTGRNRVTVWEIQPVVG